MLKWTISPKRKIVNIFTSYKRIRNKSIKQEEILFQGVRPIMSSNCDVVENMKQDR